MGRFYLAVVPLLALCGEISAQVLSFPAANPGSITTSASMNLLQATVMDSNLAFIDTVNRSSIQNPTLLLSKLDLKAPARARKEYEEGYRALLQKDFTVAIAHLRSATTIYPNYVSALNALGAAYLGLGQGQEARMPFAQAIALDGHLPNSYLNLGCAELAVGDYAGAERDIARASSMAPMDLQVRTALAYSQYMNKNYDGVLHTAKEVHSQRHDGAALVHLYAAFVLEEQGSPVDAQRELKLLLKEDPKSPAAQQAKGLLIQVQDEATHPQVTTRVGGGDMTLNSTIRLSIPDDSEERLKEQDDREQAQLAEAEAMDNAVGEPIILADASTRSSRKEKGYTFHSATDEVGIYFAATDHGKAVPDLKLEDVHVLDGQMRPARITGFRNEAKLPLRIGILIDCSASVDRRFKFEQEAARSFLQNILNGDDDLGFVVGFSNSILLAQDFSNDATLLAQSAGAYVPSGGTSMWDAVTFAVHKLAEHPEAQPVAKVLLVISDGEDNSSVATAKQAIELAQRDGVAIYTIDTMPTPSFPENISVGVRALKTLAEMTGGTAYRPGSARGFSGSLKDLQQFIRSRYLISYKPAGFKRDGSYRRVQVAAQKDGRKVRVISRSGYYATEAPAN